MKRRNRIKYRIMNEMIIEFENDKLPYVLFFGDDDLSEKNNLYELYSSIIVNVKSSVQMVEFKITLRDEKKKIFKLLKN